MKIVLLLVALLTGASAHADQVIGITDGDTLTLLHAGQAVKIRLANIDAPEKNQTFGDRAKKSLSDLCFGKVASYSGNAGEPWGRTVAVVTCDGINVNREQVKRGFAWVYTQYNRDTSLPSLQNQAKQARIGLWADANPTPPWNFRHDKTGELGSTEGCLTGPRGGRYRLVDGKKQYGCK